MDKLKRFVIALFLMLLATGCTLIKDQQYYKKIANTVISLFRDINYDESEFSSEENRAISKIVSELTHENQIVNVSDFIVKSSEYAIIESNTKGIRKENGKCYISYKDLELDSYKSDNDNYELEPHKRVVCDGYYTVVYRSDFYPSYEETQNNPLHSYSYFKGYETDNGYNFIYKSTYDGSYLTVDIDLENEMKISLSREEYNEKDLNINDENGSDGLIVTFLVVVFIICICLFVPILLKNKKERSEY